MNELPLVRKTGGLTRACGRTTRGFDPDRPLARATRASPLRGPGCRGYAVIHPDVVTLRKSSPSAGGLHPIEAYPLIRNVDGVDPGLYHYGVRDHVLALVAPFDQPAAEAAIGQLTAGQAWLGSAGAAIVLTARFSRSFWKYRRSPTAYATLLMDAGHLSQTFYLVCAELGLGAFLTNVVDSAAVVERLGLDGCAEGPLAVLGCGFPADVRSGLDPEFPFPRDNDLSARHFRARVGRGDRCTQMPLGSILGGPWPFVSAARPTQFTRGIASPVGLLSRSLLRREMRKTVTIVFTDVIDSTPLGEQLDAETYRRVISRYFIEVSRVLEHHGGTVEKFIGDAVMRSESVLHEDDALRAVRAAGELRQALAALNAELRASTGSSSGCGPASTRARSSRAIPQRATHSPPGALSRSLSALRPPPARGDPDRRGNHRLVRDAVLVEPLEPLELKGKSQPVRAWRLLGVLSGAPASRGGSMRPWSGEIESWSALREVSTRRPAGASAA